MVSTAQLMRRIGCFLRSLQPGRQQPSAALALALSRQVKSAATATEGSSGFTDMPMSGRRDMGFPRA